MKRRIRVNQEFMDAVLPPVPKDFERDMRELILSMPAGQTKREGKPVKRKFSVGLVLACVLILLAATALAAVLLGGKEFVDKIMAPKAAETASDSFTKEEIAEILRIAEENNLALSDEDMYRLNHLDESGYFKEELMRRFVKTEYGFYPDAWPIEVQHWYEQMLHAVGLQEGPQVNVLPEGDEYTQEQILQIARDFIHQKYDPDVNLDDPEKYQRFLTYREFQLGEGLKARQWNLNYEARDLYGMDYCLVLDSAGNIKNEYTVDGILGNTYQVHGQYMYDRFIRVYGNQYGFINWDSDMLLKYQEAMRHRLATEENGHFLSQEYPILKMTYLLPDDTMISREAAIEKAKEACGKLDYETLYSHSQVAVCMEADGKPVWKVTLKTKGGYVFAQLDAKTGEALIVDTEQTGSYAAWRQYVTEEYWRENDMQPSYYHDAATPNPVPAWRLPDFWGSTDLAPAWYWEKLGATGYSEETEDALYEAWVDQYGYDTHFWPLEAQAIEALTQLGDSPDFAVIDLPGLPSEGDISREEALRIAKAAFKEEYAGALPDLDASTLTGAFSFWFNYTFDGHNAWEVNLYRPDGVHVGAVWVESRTGEAFQLECFDSRASGLRMRDVSFTQPAVTPSPLENGRPWMWGMDFAPREHWEKLGQIVDEWGVTAQNFRQKYAEWCALYGSDSILWPYECQVIEQFFADYNAENFTEERVYYHTFPREGKLTREQAVAIALQAVHEAGDEQVGAAWIDDLKVNAVLDVNAWVDARYQSDEPLWIVSFYSWDAQFGYWTQRACAYLTEDGEVILADLDLYSNG
ncbi:MAG: PepSY domain-containing protein [Clostridia bacterium]|nr:PepSY domain-containing protein [Clostridia bacterium]